MSWTQPMCMACWTHEEPGRRPHRVIVAPAETCCLCGATTTDGIYVRKNPATVPYPTKEP